ncbi:aminoacyl-histidine dipeptidase [Desulfosarcina ovata subsp. sediminis]|uniref:Cytosol non-specific dipeptidase n=1 Tax=Desulfosarcina ovata subsp. sediminis TaxID=885957 RepID=A0A5K7ZIJ1_9BACT|nr:aminoacyl-histidine dipeptidase [Desulfosarcina ovata]BBO80701.1 aminoacyl-histidine dipeptidase [Desulfosarcina ovata subsp. sediminis]
MHKPTRAVIDYFEQINQHPRCSKQEQQISRWLTQWGGQRGLTVLSDRIGNLIIQVPASQGFEKAPTIILQGHMDMVCEKDAGSAHDFSKDPIRMVEDGPWLTAVETTLGADNGVAIAMALALVDNPTIAHPSLELFFTVDEETGLTGALGMDPGLLSGKILVNLDSEDEGLFVVGCAGGRDTTIRRPLAFQPVDRGYELLSVSVDGLQGGHSGLDIAKHRANANKLMARLLDATMATVPLRIVSVSGGTRKNVIPRNCRALLACPGDQAAMVASTVSSLADTIRNEYLATDSGLTIQLDQQGPAAEPCRGITEKDSALLVELLLALPDGPIEMDAQLPLLVQTSTNLAMVSIEDETLSVITSQRGSIPSRLDAICRTVEAAGRLAGVRATTDAGYPSWPMNRDSALLQRCTTLYRELFATDARVEVIHAGLECGVIGAHCPGMDMISMGPTIENPHSPSERLYLPSVEKVWRLLVALLESFGNNGQ